MNEEELLEGYAMSGSTPPSHVIEIIGRINDKIDSVCQRIESGELRREVEVEMRRWLSENPEAVVELRKTLAFFESAQDDR